MDLFNIENKVILITGGGGVLGGSMAKHLTGNNATVIILDRDQVTIDKALETLNKEPSVINSSSTISGLVCDVLNKGTLEQVCRDIIEKHGKIDVLINAAGGNKPGATIGEEQTIFDLEIDDFKSVVDLNLFGSIIPSLVFGKEMVKSKKGVIINISSMASHQAITRVVGYSASKAAIDNYTRWLATELALKFGDGLRVNAIAPGFFIGNQNRALLTKEDGSYTERGDTIIMNTPMKRFGETEELNGTIHYLCSEASKFVTGVVIPIDGGFSAFSGV